jgi:hypothetical protein
MVKPLKGAIIYRKAQGMQRGSHVKRRVWKVAMFRHQIHETVEVHARIKGSARPGESPQGELFSPQGIRGYCRGYDPRFLGPIGQQAHRGKDLWQLGPDG